MNEKIEPQIQTAIRLPRAFLKRLDKLAMNMSKSGIKVTRSEVIRHAALKGIEQLEKELPKTR